MKPLNPNTFVATVFWACSLTFASISVWAQCPPNCPPTKKTVNIYWVDLGVEQWGKVEAADWELNKARSNSKVKVYNPPKPEVKFGDSLERLGGATVPGVSHEGEIALPMPAGRPMTREELNELKDKIVEQIQSKIDQGITEIELRGIQDITLLQHVTEARNIGGLVPKPLSSGLHLRQQLTEQITEVAGQALAKVKFTNANSTTNVDVRAVCGSNGCRTMARVIPHLGRNVITTATIDSPRASEADMNKLIKAVGAANVAIIAPVGDAPALPGVVADLKTAERIADNNPGVSLYRTKNPKGLLRTPLSAHIEVTKPSNISIESRRYLGKGKYTESETASRADFLRDRINGVGIPFSSAKETYLDASLLTPKVQKARRRLVLANSDKGSNPNNSDDHFTVDKSIGTYTLRDAQRVLQNQLSRIADFTASNETLLRKLRQGERVKVIRANDEERDRLVKIEAEAREGFARTNVHIVNKTDDIIAIDFSEFYLNPENENSSSQRLGLVAVVEQRVSMHMPADSHTRLATFNNADSFQLNNADGDTPIRLMKASFSPAFESHPLITQDRGEPQFLAVKNWVIVAPRADVIVPFHSVCLDSGRGTPPRGERFYASDRPLPTRVQQILVAAALRGEVPQSQVWGTIRDERIKWHDPRDGLEALRRAKSEYGSGQYNSAIESSRMALSYKPEWPAAIAMMGLSYYSMGLNSQDTDQASNLLSESYKHLSKAMELGQEFTFPVKHHISEGMDQRLSTGEITLTKDSLSYRSTDNEGRNLKALYSQVYELRMEAQKFGRLHMNIYGVAYNFHPSQTYTTRETVYLTPTAPFSRNVLHCDGTCYLNLSVINSLVSHFISRSARMVDSLKDSGESLMKNDKLAEAEAKFREAMQFNPYDIQLLTNLGLVLMRQQKMAAAEEQFRIAAKIAPNEGQAYINLGTALVGQQKWKEAEAEFRRAVKLDSKNANWRGSLGIVLNQQKKWGDAETQLREAVKMLPNNAQWHANLGYTLMNRKKLAEAEAHYREAVRLDSGNAFWHLGLGGVFEKQQKLAETETEYREALRLAPENPLILNNLGYHLVQKGKNLDEALRMIEQAVKAEPKNANSLDSLGWAYFKFGKLEEAERYLKEAAQIKSDSAPIQEHLGDLYQRLGKIEQARAAWLKAASLPEEEPNQKDRLKTKIKAAK